MSAAAGSRAHHHGIAVSSELPLSKPVSSQELTGAELRIGSQLPSHCANKTHFYLHFLVWCQVVCEEVLLRRSTGGERGPFRLPPAPRARPAHDHRCPFLSLHAIACIFESRSRESLHARSCPCVVLGLGMLGALGMLPHGHPPTPPPPTKRARLQPYSQDRLLVTLDGGNQIGRTVVQALAVAASTGGVVMERMIQAPATTRVARFLVTDGTSVLEKAAHIAFTSDGAGRRLLGPRTSHAGCGQAQVLHPAWRCHVRSRRSHGPNGQPPPFLHAHVQRFGAWSQTGS